MNQELNPMIDEAFAQEMFNTAYRGFKEFEREFGDLQSAVAESADSVVYEESERLMFRLKSECLDFENSVAIAYMNGEMTSKQRDAMMNFPVNQIRPNLDDMDTKDMMRNIVAMNLANKEINRIKSRQDPHERKLGYNKLGISINKALTAATEKKSQKKNMSRDAHELSR